jgi:hypothetical protein
VKRVEASFIAYEKVDNDAGGQPDCKAEDVDECIQRTLPDIAQGNRKIIFDHRYL